MLLVRPFPNIKYKILFSVDCKTNLLVDQFMVEGKQHTILYAYAHTYILHMVQVLL